MVVFIKFTTSGLGQLCGRGGESAEPEEMEDTKKTGPSKHHRTDKHTRQCTGPEGVCTRQGDHRAERGGHRSPFSTRVYLQLIPLANKNLFLSKGVSQGKQTALGNLPTQQCVWGSPKVLSGLFLSFKFYLFNFYIVSLSPSLPLTPALQVLWVYIVAFSLVFSWGP